MAEKYEGRKFETIFEGRAIPDDTRMAEIMEWGAKLFAMGLLPGESGRNVGNFSFRNDKGFVITAGGVNKGKLTPKNFVQVIGCNLDTKKVRAIGELEPSSETMTHHLLYRERHDINAIIHVHDNLVMEQAEALGIKVTENVHPYGTTELAYEIEKAVGSQRYIGIKGHGVISLGKSVWEAGRIVLTMHRDAEHESKG